MAASRFEKYRVVRGDDIGDPDYWNRRLRDVDTRLVAVEDQKDTLDAVIEEGRTVFRSRVDEILVPLVQEVEAIADLGALLRAHSSSEVEITTGGKTFFVDEADRRRFAAPGYLSIVAAGNPSLAMSGRLVSYSEATGELVIDVDQVDGSGWGADWSISVGNTTDAATDAATAAEARAAAVAAAARSETILETVTDAASIVAVQAEQAVTANGQAQTAAIAAAQSAADAVGYLVGYLGTHSAPPTTRADGSALHPGDWYFRSVPGSPARYLIDYWDGTVWRSLTAAADTSVTSFSGRTGGVVPADGDYRGDQVARTAAQQAILGGATVEAALQSLAAALANGAIDGGTFG